MQRYTVEERVEIVKTYFKNHENLKKTQSDLEGKFKFNPSTTAIRNVILKFNNMGTVCNKKYDGRHKWARSNDIIESVKESVARDPTASLRTRAKELGITRSTLRRILYEDLEMGVQEVEQIVDDNQDNGQKINEFPPIKTEVL